jgi:hypothetical protein
MNTLSATRLRADLYRVLESVITSGQSVEVVLRGRKVRIVSIEPVSRVQSMQSRADYIVGDPDELVRPNFDAAWDRKPNKRLKR